MSMDICTKASLLVCDAVLLHQASLPALGRSPGPTLPTWVARKVGSYRGLLGLIPAWSHRQPVTQAHRVARSHQYASSGPHCSQ
jgi:hypothetical protein